MHLQVLGSLCEVALALTGLRSIVLCCAVVHLPSDVAGMSVSGIVHVSACARVAMK